jgi:hypothetical protein
MLHGLSDVHGQLTAHRAPVQVADYFKFLTSTECPLPSSPFNTGSPRLAGRRGVYAPVLSIGETAAVTRATEHLFHAMSLHKAKQKRRVLALVSSEHAIDQSWFDENTAGAITGHDLSYIAWLPLAPTATQHYIVFLQMAKKKKCYVPAPSSYVVTVAGKQLTVHSLVAAPACKTLDDGATMTSEIMMQMALAAELALPAVGDYAAAGEVKVAGQLRAASQPSLYTNTQQQHQAIQQAATQLYLNAQLQLQQQMAALQQQQQQQLQLQQHLLQQQQQLQLQHHLLQQQQQLQQRQQQLEQQQQRILQQQQQQQQHSSDEGVDSCARKFAKLVVGGNMIDLDDHAELSSDDDSSADSDAESDEQAAAGKRQLQRIARY